MSGGSLDYFYFKLEEHAKDLGDKELNELVADLATLFHDREWYLSGDTGEGDWNEARDAFKEKWFTEHGRQERIEKYLAEFAEEVRQTFGMSRRYCWSTVEGYKTHGRCELDTRYMTHPSDSCDKDSFEEKEHG